MKSVLERLPLFCSLKTCLFIVAGIITVQYLVNFTIYFHNESPFFKRNSSYWTALQNMSGIYLTVTTTTRPINLTECPVIPPGLRGRLTVNTQIPAWAHIEEDNPNVTSGGRYKPPDCIARHRVAIVIPYRDREIHLKLFLQNLHPFLQRQQLDYGIYVVEMANGVQFNRALLMNVGFAEAMEQYEYDCFIFHDVDLLPEDDRNLYTCPSMPRHMSTAIDKLKYKLPYPQIFGGVSAISTHQFKLINGFSNLYFGWGGEDDDMYRRLPYPQIFGGVSAISTHQFKLINGFSNLYFGWGGEDDDMYRRIIYSNLTVTRYSNQVARYKMLVHKKASGNPERFKLLKTVKKRRGSDGISSLKYTLIKLEKKPLYTWILVSVNMTAVLNDEPIHKQAMRPGQLPPGKNTQQQQQQQQQQKQQQPQQPLSPQVKQPFQNNAKGQLTKTVANKPAAVKEDNKNWQAVMVKKKAPQIINWVPADYTGTLPDYLTKFETANFVYQPVPKVVQPAKNNKPQVNRPNPKVAKGKVAVNNNPKIIKGNVAKGKVAVNNPNILKGNVVATNPKSVKGNVSGNMINTGLSHEQRLHQLKQQYIQFQKQRANSRQQKLQARMKRPYNNVPVQPVNTQYVQVPSSNGVIVHYEGVN